MERPHESIELMPHTVITRSENEDLPSPLKDKSSNLKKRKICFFLQKKFYVYVFIRYFKRQHSIRIKYS